MGIVNDKGEVLANEKNVYKPPLGMGIVPQDAAKHHDIHKEILLKNAVDKSGISLSDVNIVAYSCGAGLSPCLLVGANFALELAEGYNKPIVKVCHQLAHIEIGRLTTGSNDPIILYLSGGNSQIIAFSEGRYRIFGQTLDIPVGNCLDVIAREMGLPFPGGLEIERLAKNGKYVELPYVVKGLDLSFSGILTNAIKGYKSGISKEDIAYSIQETCFAMLTEVTERALAHTGKDEVLLVGGVAANKRLQSMLETMVTERSARLYVVPQEYSGDNGAMIGWVGILAHKSKWKPNFKDKIKPRWRTEDVEITWVK